MKTVRTGYLIPVLLVLSLVLSACTREASVKQEHLPMWKVTSEKATVYLLGSVHLLKSTDYPLDERIDKAFYESGTAVFELDMRKSESMEGKALVLDYSFFRGKETLEGSLSENAYQELAIELKKLGVEISALSKLKPWSVATMLTVLKLEHMGFRRDFGVDTYYFTKALTMGKDVRALETLEYQIGLFNSMSARDQDAFVRETLREIWTLDAEFPRIVAGWKAGDTKSLGKLLEPCRNFQKVCDEIITSRNHIWADIAEGYLNEGGTFFVVAGAAHMVGKEGLPALLKKRGYKVEQL